eukprot:gene25728-11386_t
MQALPHRRIESVQQHLALKYHSGNHKGTLSVEEKEKLCHLVQKYRGRKQMWTIIAKLIGRSRTVCRVLWVESRIGDKRKYGKWSSEEENRLRLLVREQIAVRKEKEAAEMKLGHISNAVGAAVASLTPPSGRHYRDRVNFEPIAEKLGTRPPKMCLNKWYCKLSPSLFSSGEWDLGDDITLVRALQAGGCEWPWEVEWDRLVPNRTAELAKRRWRSMLKALPDGLEKSFDVCVEELAEKYSSHRCRQLLENLKW